MGKVVALPSAVFSKLAQEKVESSGLSVRHAQSLGIYAVENAATLHQSFDARPALVLPYYGADGKALAAQKGWDQFYRVRYLVEDKSFKAAAGKQSPKYVQPPGSGVCAYFPSNIDWKHICADTSETILITEGELKAAKACEQGFVTLGLGGVDSYKSTGNGILFLPELQAIKWTQRNVIICYDSDYKDNPNICRAINGLGEELCERGALVSMLTLPDVYDDGRKTGLDDYLVEEGDEALSDLLATRAPLTMVRDLWRMNDILAYVADPSIVIEMPKKGRKWPVEKFLGHSDYSTNAVPERRVNKDGSLSMVKGNAAAAWFKWPLRRAVDKITYMPGKEKFPVIDNMRYFNNWLGWGCAPVKGNVKPWLELIKFLFAGLEPEGVEWFLDWCAYPLQFPGTKLFSACLIHGRMTGTGKTLIFYTLKRIYGENFAKIKNSDLDDSWWIENKQFVLGDEISGRDKRGEADSFKNMITQEEVSINVKFIPQYTLPDCTNYGFTSNHIDAMFMEDADRRLFVHEVQAEAPLPESFYKEYDEWKESEAGPAALFHWLLQRDLSKFNPKGPAYKTAARERMIMHGKSDLDVWCHDLKMNPASKLRVGQMRHVRDLFTSAELLEMYKAEHGQETSLTVNGMSRALGKVGLKQANEGRTIKLNDDKQHRYFMVRNAEKWAKVKNLKELVKHCTLTPVRD